MATIKYCLKVGNLYYGRVYEFQRTFSISVICIFGLLEGCFATPSHFFQEKRRKIIKYGTCRFNPLLMDLCS